MKVCNDKYVLCLYVIDVRESTKYLIICYGTGALYFQEMDIGFGIQERKLVDM